MTVRGGAPVRLRVTRVPTARRAVALLLASFVSVVAPTPARAQGAAEAVAVPSSATAAWLVGLLGPDAMVVDPALGIEDVDATLDLLLGLVASGAAGPTREAVADRLIADVASHTGTGLDATFVAATAKLALVLPAAGRDARDVGGTDLVALLSGRVGTDGRARDRSALGDLSTPRSQALTVLALARAGADPTVLLRAADALAGAACPDGGMPAEFDPASCTTDAPTTALAAAAFAASASGVGADVALADARDAALGVLLARDAAGDLDPWSAGVTTTALRAVGRDAEADAIADGLTSRLDGCSGGATAALIDADPLRATVGALLAASGATLIDLTADGAGPPAAPLDCTPDAAAGTGAAEGSGATGGSGASDEAASGGTSDGAAADAASRRVTPAVVAVAVLGMVLLAGIPVVRSARRRERATGSTRHS